MDVIDIIDGQVARNHRDRTGKVVVRRQNNILASGINDSGPTNGPARRIEYATSRADVQIPLNVRCDQVQRLGRCNGYILSPKDRDLTTDLVLLVVQRKATTVQVDRQATGDGQFFVLGHALAQITRQSDLGGRDGNALASDFHSRFSTVHDNRANHEIIGIRKIQRSCIDHGHHTDKVVGRRTQIHIVCAAVNCGGAID